MRRLLLPLTVFVSVYGASAQAHELTRINPSGEDVPAERQLVLSFREAVVPLGRMERKAEELPVTISPALNCQWRWIDPSNLACELNEADALKPATRYTVSVAAGPFEGGEIAEPFEHSFVTQRPALAWDSFKTWRSPGWPVVRLVFNQPVTRSSMAEHVYLDAAGGRQRVTVSPDPEYGDTPVVVPLPGEAAALVTEGEAVAPNSPVVGRGSEEARTVWLVEPQDELPGSTPVKIMLEAGLRSAEGPEPSVASREVAALQTFPEFRFLGLGCTDLAGEEVAFEPGIAGIGRCNPLSGTHLRFTAPVVVDELKKALKLTPDLAGGRTDYDPWANQEGYSRLDEPNQADSEYRVSLPEFLKANQAYSLRFAPGLKDEFGRTLVGDGTLEFATSHRAPELRMLHRHAVLEQGVASDVPLVVTNLQNVNFSHTRRNSAGTDNGLEQLITPYNVTDLAFFYPLGLREMLGGQSGVVSGVLSANPAPIYGNNAQHLFAQVTPYEVHAKIGHYNSLVWVTEFASGKPVEGASLRVLSGVTRGLMLEEAALAEARTDSQGVAVLPGAASLDPERALLGNWSENKPSLMIEVKRGKAMALLPLSSDYQLDVGRVTDWDIYSDLRSQYQHLHAWGTTAQGVYRLGDSVQFKLYVRDQSNRHWVAAPKDGRYTLTIKDPMDKVVHHAEGLALSAFGALDGEFPLPKSGAVGWYRFELQADFLKDQTLSPLQVLVSDFTPAPFKVTTRVQGERFAPGDKLVINTTAALHSGGPYRDARARQIGRLQSRRFESKAEAARGFSFEYEQGGEQTLFTLDGEVNEQGQLENSVTLADSTLLYGNLLIEGSVRDERGKSIAAATSALYAARDRFIGLKQRDWLLTEAKPATVDVLVTDAAGEPVAGSKVEVVIEVETITAARVKGAGNAYLTEYNRAWEAAGRCTLISTTQGKPCEFTPNRAGRYRITASLNDSKNRPLSTQQTAWAEGQGRVLWAGEQDYALQMQVERTTLSMKDDARIMVQNPFEKATALVTVERYGVLNSFVKEFTKPTEVLEIPIRPEYAPGFFVSVTLLSPRVSPVLSAEGVDLGKPALRMGYRQFAVQEPVKQLEVFARSDKARYQPRDTVTLDLRAHSPTGGKEPVELAVVVLDEAVLDLIAAGTSAYDPYQGFNRLDGLDLQNYSLLMALVGQQKFPKKGASPGGDGGADLSLRSLFKFVSYWNPSLPTDRNGNATVKFPLPDNLTGWRVLVMAVTPGERMGLGQSRFTVSQDTELRPVMPNNVREGDVFSAGFTVLNRTDREREITVDITADGPLEGGQAKHEQRVKLAPFGKSRVDMTLKTRAPGTVRLAATAGDSEDGQSDGLVHEVPVLKNRTLRVAASYAASVDGPITEKLLFPQTMHTDVGQLKVTASATVLGNIDGAFRYLRDYPYMCWEQRLSKGVMAAHYGALKPWLAQDLLWPESGQLPKQLLSDAASFQAPNGGMSFWLAEDEHVSPYLSAYTGLAFEWLRGHGYVVSKPVDDKLMNYLSSYLRHDASPDFYTEGMSSTVRAVALAALSRRGLASSEDLARYAEHMPRMSLFGKAHYLQAAVNLAGPQAPEAVRTLDAILGHAHQSAGKLVLTEALDDGYVRILDSANRTHCAVLSALTRMKNNPATGELPTLLVRTITAARGQKDGWENTQENLFCMQALNDYAQAYEAEEPALHVNAKLDGVSFGAGELQGRKAPPLSLLRPFEATDPGKAAQLSVERSGQGRLYVATHLSYADKKPDAAASNAGIELVREVSVERQGQWQLLTSPMTVKRGELVRVDLFLRLPAARHFVVVNDPLPGGLETVNTQLATASTVDAEKGAFQAAGGSFWGRYSDWREYGYSFWSFYHKELRHDSARFYSEYLPAGNYHLSYTAQAIAPGHFVAPAARAEEMYTPEVYGLSAPAVLVVTE